MVQKDFSFIWTPISDKTTSLTPSFHDREPFQRYNEIVRWKCISLMLVVTNHRSWKESNCKNGKQGFFKLHFPIYTYISLISGIGLFLEMKPKKLKRMSHIKLWHIHTSLNKSRLKWIHRGYGQIKISNKLIIISKFIIIHHYY